MVVILDTATGAALNFRTRKQAAEFIGVSLPTLRTMLSEPFFLYKSLIITITNHEKIKKGERELLYKVMRDKAEREIEMAKRFHIQGVFPHIGDVPVNGSRPKQPANLGRD